MSRWDPTAPDSSLAPLALLARDHGTGHGACGGIAGPVGGFHRVLASSDPRSPAVQSMTALLLCQAPSAAPHETVGAFLSTLLPAIGPAAVQLPELSQNSIPGRAPRGFPTAPVELPLPNISGTGRVAFTAVAGRQRLLMEWTVRFEELRRITCLGDDVCWSRRLEAVKLAGQLTVGYAGRPATDFRLRVHLEVLDTTLFRQTAASHHLHR